MSQQNPEGKSKDIWTRLGQTIKTSAETIVQETKELTRIGKLKVELMSLENERGRKYEEIGRMAHTLYKAGTVFPPELSELFTAVDAVEKRIAEKNQEIERVKIEGELTKEKTEKQVSEVSPEVRTCPQCGTQLQPGYAFCPKCGARVG